MLGYADDDWLLAPSLNALQDMLNTCEKYNLEHGLRFSTDPKPSKSKTKCIAFLKADRELQPLTLCGNKLPWVKTGKHVGQNVTDKADGLKKDMLIKRARFIDRNNTLRQEFFFAHPRTLLHINQVYNSDYSGSPVWDLFCRETEMVENSYSVAVRLMLGLPRETHRYLIEPLTEKRHIKFDLISRFLNFNNKIKNSKKETLIYIYKKVHRDVRSITGQNLNNIKLLCGYDDIDDFKPNSCDDLLFHKVPPGEDWRINLIREIIDVKYDERNIENLDAEEIDEILEFVCTSGIS